jgi:paraquat-inducible protein A
VTLRALSLPDSELVACHECDAVQAKLPLTPGDVLACSRCGAHLIRSRGHLLPRILPYTIAATILFIVANACPVVALEVAGNRTSTSILGAVIELYQKGVIGVAAVVGLTGFAVPALELGLLLYALSALSFGRRLPGLFPILRILAQLRPWAMVEIFLLGVLVSLVKLAGLARVIPGVGLWALFGLIVMTAIARSNFDVPAYAEKIEELE